MSENNVVEQVETVETMDDTEATHVLRKLFARYQELKKDRPKLKGEAYFTPKVWDGTLDIQATIDDLKTKLEKWSQRIYDVMTGIEAVGSENPNANIQLVTKGGRTVSANGTRLLSALLREDAAILSAKLKS